jgi:hypothetical protein
VYDTKTRTRVKKLDRSGTIQAYVTSKQIIDLRKSISFIKFQGTFSEFLTVEWLYNSRFAFALHK